MDLRLKVTGLDIEARLRARAEARGQRDLLPPFEVKLSEARAEVAKAVEVLDKPPFSEDEIWQQLRTDLQSYLESTMDLRQYSLAGFEDFEKSTRNSMTCMSEMKTVSKQLFKAYRVLNAVLVKRLSGGYWLHF